MSCRSNYQPKTWLGPRQESAGRRSYSQWRSKPRARRYRLSTPKRPGSQWVPTATPWSHWAKTRKIQPARSRPEENVYRYLGLPAKIHYRCNQQAGGHQRSCHHHAAKQESQRPAEYSNDVQDILQAEHSNRAQSANREERG